VFWRPCHNQKRLLIPIWRECPAGRRRERRGASGRPAAEHSAPPQVGARPHRCGRTGPAASVQSRHARARRPLPRARSLLCRQVRPADCDPRMPRACALSHGLRPSLSVSGYSEKEDNDGGFRIRVCCPPFYLWSRVNLSRSSRLTAMTFRAW
jgi:hypothetical protein